MEEMTDKLIQKAASGDQDAIARLYELTYSSVYKTVKALIADEDTVLDILQDSYIKGFQSLEQLDEPGNFRAWMKRIAVNKAKDYLKKKKPILFTDMANEDGDEIDFRDDCLEHSPEAVLDRKETARLMQEILASLSEEQRMVIGMFYYEEMTVREIAEVLGCSENTVKSRLNYGRKKIEVQVRALEKQGTKLYSLAPLPFLLWLFRLDAKAAEVPSAKVLRAVTARCGAAGVASTAGAAVAGVGSKALAAKITAGILAAAIVGGGALVAISSREPGEAGSTQPSVTQETQTATESETTVPVTEAEVTAAEAYDQVMRALSDACAVDSGAWLADPEKYHAEYSYLNTAKLDNYHRYGGISYYYAYADLDGNGVEELIISEVYQVEPHENIISMYSFDGTGAVEILECGDENLASICADGSVMLDEGIILEGTATIWVLGEDGVHPEILARYRFDLYTDTYQNESETLSAQAYYEKYAPNGFWTLEWNLLVE